jgi:hypothetical protein
LIHGEFAGTHALDSQGLERGPGDAARFHGKSPASPLIIA